MWVANYDYDVEANRIAFVFVGEDGDLEHTVSLVFFPERYLDALREVSRQAAAGYFTWYLAAKISKAIRELIDRRFTDSQA